MPRVILVGLLLFVSLFLEGTLISLPLLVAAVVLSSVMFRSGLYIFIVFLLGIIFDIVSVQRIGQTSIFLLGIVGAIELYDKKFEVRTLPFVLFACAVSVTVYLLIFGSYAFFIQLITSVLFSGVLYLLFMKAGFITREQ